MGNSNNHQTSSAAPHLQPHALQICPDEQHHLGDACTLAGGFGTRVCAMGADKAR